MSDRALALALATFVGGIAAADAGLRLAPVLLASLVLGLLAVAAARLSVAPRRALAAGLAALFLAGVLRLELRLGSADVDAARVAAVEPGDLVASAASAGSLRRAGSGRGVEPIRYVDASVLGRTERAWGLEIVLADLRPVVPAAPLPRRALLSVAIEEADARAGQLLLPGGRVRVGLRLAPIGSKRNPGTPDRALRWRRRGIAVRARLVDANWVVSLQPTPGARAPAIAGTRAALLERVGPSLRSRAGGGLALALVLGDRSALEAPTRAAFRELGLAHLVAISGLHVGLVGGAAALGVGAAMRVAGARRRSTGAWRASGRGTRAPPRRGTQAPPRRGALVLGAAVAIVYAGLAGASPAVQRAAMVFGLAAAASGLRRDLSAARALCGAGFVLLVVEPAWLFDLGARLTFSACAALAAVGFTRTPSAGQSPPPDTPAFDASRAVGSVVPEEVRGDARDLRHHLRRAPGVGGQAVEASLRTTLAASFATAPWLVAAGLPLSVWSAVANLVAVPALALVALPSALLATAAAAIRPTALASTEAGSGVVLPDVALAAEAAAAGAGRWGRPGLLSADGFDPTASLLRPVHALERAVDAAAATLPAMPRPDLLALPLLVMACLGGLALTRRGHFGKASVAWLAIALLGTPPCAGPGDLVARPRVVYLDVGQGDAALVQADHAEVLIDTGAGNRLASGAGAVERALRALGTASLDALVVTHGDFDHRGGAAELIARMPLRELWLPAGRGAGDDRLQQLARQARSRGVRVRWLAAGAERELGGARFEVLSPLVATSPARVGPPSAGAGRGPSTDRAAPASRADNEDSLVLRVSVDGIRHLLTADIGVATERRLLRSGLDVSAEVLKVGHHGSGGSTSPAFLAAVAPQLAIVSAPCEPHRGLPHPTILERLGAAGVALAWTGRDGAVSVARWGGVVEHARWAGSRRCPGDPGMDASGGRRPGR